MKDYKMLMSPITIGNLVFKNRIIGAPTSFYDITPEGYVTQQMIDHFANRARGGAACITLGECIVERSSGLSHLRQIAIDDEQAVSGLSRLCEAVHAQGGLISLELSHGGALCDQIFIGGKHAIGPSGYIDIWGDEIDEMSIQDMERIAEAFGTCALRAKRCGFDMCMIHGGHGWLLHQFVSPITNKRLDEFGGSIQNRMRFPLMVIDSIRKHCGSSFPIEYRMSGSERCEGGYDIDTGIEIAKLLDGKVDIIHVSAGTQQFPYSAVLMHPSAYQEDGENTKLAKEIRKYVKTPVTTVGAIQDPDLMEELLENGTSDLISVGRSLIADPYFPLKVEHGLTDKITPCLRCYECQDSMNVTRMNRCSVNPQIGFEGDILRSGPGPYKKKFLVVGGGPAGMYAALYASAEGHEVVLCEVSSRLGGALWVAEDSGAWFKRKIKLYKEKLIDWVSESDIDVRLNTKVTKELVKELKPNVLLAAVGADPIVPPIRGIDSENVFQGAYLEDYSVLGDNIIFIGGGSINCEMAAHLYREGKTVTIIELTDKIASDAGTYNRIIMEHETEPLTIYLNMDCKEILKDAVRCVNAEGKEVLIPCDSVVVSVGMKPRIEEAMKLRGLTPFFRIIGNANRPGKIINATRSAYDAVRFFGNFK